MDITHIGTGAGRTPIYDAGDKPFIPYEKLLRRVTSQDVVGKHGPGPDAIQFPACSVNRSSRCTAKQSLAYPRKKTNETGVVSIKMEEIPQNIACDAGPHGYTVECKDSKKNPGHCHLCIVPMGSHPNYAYSLPHAVHAVIRGKLTTLMEVEIPPRKKKTSKR